MVRAYIMVEATTGDVEALADQLSGFDNVTVANVVAGEFDVIVEAESAEVYDIIHSVASRTRGLDEVADTKTYVCLE